MSSEELNANMESILSGKLPGSELVIGIVGAVGANLNNIVRDITKCLKEYDYTSQEIRVSELIETITSVPDHDSGDEFERASALMTAGDNARGRTGENAILALAVVAHIYGNRDEVEGGVGEKPRHAYIINSLKHPDEVSALRRIYGDGFYLFGVYVEPEKRRFALVNSKGMSEDEALRLMRRDEAEGPAHGQRTRDTFHLSDMFVHLMANNDRDVEKTQKTLKRFLEIIFAHPFKTPLFDEYAMFMAFAAATRSADLSRQIGAVIARDDNILSTGANECPRSGGGTYWPSINRDNEVSDVEDGRDYMRGEDTNQVIKNRIITDTTKAIKRALTKAGVPHLKEDDWALLNKALRSSTIKDITEYGRMVHAEMDALMTCARENIPCKGATLYTTTFPCHNCAKHIIAAGIKRVVYVEPYPKSKAMEFHEDSACVGFECDRHKGDDRVYFEPFVGVGPRKFYDLFSMNQGSGFPIIRKDGVTGKTLTGDWTDGIMRVPEMPWSYLKKEEIATSIFSEHTKGGNSDE